MYDCFVLLMVVLISQKTVSRITRNNSAHLMIDEKNSYLLATTLMLSMNQRR